MNETEIIRLHNEIMRNLYGAGVSATEEKAINAAYATIYSSIKQTLIDELGE